MTNKPEVIDLTQQGPDETSVIAKWSMREGGLIIAALLRYNDEHNTRVDLLESGASKEAVLAPILERLGYTLTDPAVIAAALAIKQCVAGDGQDPQMVFTDQILDLRALEKEGIVSWLVLKHAGFPLGNAPCPCGSRKSFGVCCKTQWVFEENKHQFDKSKKGTRRRVKKVTRRRKGWKCNT